MNVRNLPYPEGLIQKTRQTVVVSVWGARLYPAMGICVLNVQYCVHTTQPLYFSPFTFVGEGVGGMLYVYICISSLKTYLIILFIILVARMTQNI